MSDIALKMSKIETAPLARRRSQLARLSGWYGVWWVIATEGSLFAYLLFSYYYCLMQAGAKWPLGGPPSLLLPTLSTIVLVASSLILGWSQWSLANEAKPRLAIGLLPALALGLIFLALQVYDLMQKGPTISASTYQSFYVLLTGLDFLHAAAGVLALAALLAWTLQDRIVGIRTSYVSIIAAYWHFIVVVWLAIYATLILLPYLN